MTQDESSARHRHTITEVATLDGGILALVGRVEAGDGAAARLEQLKEIRFAATDFDQPVSTQVTLDDGCDLFQVTFEQRAMRLLVLIGSVIVHQFRPEGRVVDEAADIV